MSQKSKILPRSLLEIAAPHWIMVTRIFMWNFGFKLTCSYLCQHFSMEFDRCEMYLQNWMIYPIEPGGTSFVILCSETSAEIESGNGCTYWIEHWDEFRKMFVEFLHLIQTFSLSIKTGSTKECSNNRLISLLSHASRVLQQTHLSSQSRPEQAVFFKGSGTREKLLIIRQITGERA